MIDLPDLIDENPNYLKNFADSIKTTIIDMEKASNYLNNNSLDYLSFHDVYYDKSDINLLKNRLDIRYKGVQKYNYDLENNPNKASLYKTYFLLSLAEKEHWYKTDVDSDVISLEVFKHLNFAKSIIENRPPSPNDESWEKIRKDYPSMMYDIVENIEKAKNKIQQLVNNNLRYDNKSYWEISRFFELYSIVSFDNDDDPYSEPSSPIVRMHPSDSFIKNLIKPEEFIEKHRHKDIMLDNMSSIREDAIYLTKKYEEKNKIKKRNKLNNP